MAESRSPPPFAARDPDIVSTGPVGSGGVFEKADSGVARPVLPFASDWGGSYFCYDLRGPRDASGEYPVLYWNHEYSEEPDDRPNLWAQFAPDFVTFVRKVITAT